jgi:hypothetical protein
MEAGARGHPKPAKTPDARGGSVVECMLSISEVLAPTPALQPSRQNNMRLPLCLTWITQNIKGARSIDSASLSLNLHAGQLPTLELVLSGV